jgi:hypothetical protein
MNCAECGATFTPYKADQRFCSAAHKNRYHNKANRQRAQAIHDEALLASTELETLKEQLEHLKEQNEQFKSSIKRHHDILDEKDKEIDHWKDLVRIRDKEIERLKFEAPLQDKNIAEVRKLTSILVTNNIHKQYDDYYKKTFREYTPVGVEAIRTFGARFFHDVVRAY